MNLCLLDPFKVDYPEVIEEYLEHGITKCIAFNRRGTLLAAGCEDGSCVIWDFDTRGVAKELRAEALTNGTVGRPSTSPKDILSVSWSKGGHKLLAAGADRTLSLWDVAKGVRERVVGFETVVMSAQMHPQDGNLCLACPQFSAPLLVDLHTGAKRVLPTEAQQGDALPDAGNQLPRNVKNGSDGMATAVPAIFDKRGENVFIGTVKGDVLIMDVATMSIRSVVTVPSGTAIRQLSLSRDGCFLLVLYDKVIRVFENLMPSLAGSRKRAASGSVQGIESSQGGKHSMSTDRANGQPLLRRLKEFQDAVNRKDWKAACFSGDAELVMGATREHKITMWNRNFGHFTGLLDGPKEGLLDLAWHPTRPIAASVSTTGVVNVWAKDYTENWSAFAPDFKELEENEEYVEREDEFDIIPEAEKVKPARTDEEEDIDIETVDRVAAFSDSDDDDGLHYLPVIVERDLPEIVADDFDEGPTFAHAGLENARVRGSAEEVGTEGTPGLGADSAAEDEADMGGTGRPKRKRKVTEKAAESLQAKLKSTPKGRGDTPNSTPQKLSVDGRGGSSQPKEKTPRMISPSLPGHMFADSPNVYDRSERSSSPEEFGQRALSGERRPPFARPKDMFAVTSPSSERARTIGGGLKKGKEAARRKDGGAGKSSSSKEGKIKRKLNVGFSGVGKASEGPGGGGGAQPPSGKRLKTKVARFDNSLDL